jgi:hypothetical protein
MSDKERTFYGPFPSETVENVKSVRDMMNFKITSIDSEHELANVDGPYLLEHIEPSLDSPEASTFSIQCEYFSFPLRLEVESGTARFYGEKNGRHVSFMRNSALTVEEKGVFPCIKFILQKVRDIVTSSIRNQLVGVIGQVFDKEREWSVKDKGVLNEEDIHDPQALYGVLFQTKLTSHKIAIGYHFDKDVYTYRLKKHEENDIETYAGNNPKQAAIDVVYDVRNYFKNAKKS